MIYKCEYCNYSTNRQNSYEKHCSSKKHNDNLSNSQQEYPKLDTNGYNKIPELKCNKAIES